MHDFLVFPNRAGINQPTLPESPRGRSARRMGGGGGIARALVEGDGWGSAAEDGEEEDLSWFGGGGERPLSVALAA